MFQDFFARSDLMDWPIVGLFIFVTVFTGVLAYTIFGLRNKNKVDAMAAIPLCDDSGDVAPAAREASSDE